ncbi:MAG TPA: AmmeMemoRadiSam system protein A [Candidatus Tenderia electrophaga]|uniref:AmmeMemoRadiSam system protein A n=1 Tax=Candidatus Tenderia electrophaga TaxID=1748243 RepID=A0A832N588_9GAMM|nr:AmmeMemoRadiSam system protein A [Candidatus Tenderia electrophaga]
MQQTLLTVARQSIFYGLQHGQPMPVHMDDYPPPLRQQRATFVTLNIGGQLRGCIGTLEAHRLLLLDVAHNAYAAAFNDPRFLPLSQAEFEQLEIHISILSPAEEMAFTSEQGLINQLRPGIDGLILQAGQQRGTFLPSVWQQLPEPEQFIQQLKLKAGLPANYWSANLRVWRYTSLSFP